MSFVTAPAIIKYSNLMPVKAYAADGISLYNAAHPWSNQWSTAADLTESSLLELMVEIRRNIDFVTGIRGLRLR